MINSTLAAELAGSVHALAIKAQAPGKAAAEARRSLADADSFADGLILVSAVTTAITLRTAGRSDIRRR